MPVAGDERANFGGYISVSPLHVRRQLQLFTESAFSAVPDSAVGYRCAGNGLSLPAIGCSPAPPPARSQLRSYSDFSGRRAGRTDPVPTPVTRAPADVPGGRRPSPHRHPLHPTPTRGHPRAEAAPPGEAGSRAHRSGPGPRAERASGSGGREHARAQPNHGAGRGGGCAGARA